jgi:Flp pilus assembly protein TadD
VSWYSLRKPLFATALALSLVVPVAAQTLSDYPEMTPEPSMTSKLSSSVKSGFSKMSHALVPKASTKEAPDPISLSVPAKPSPDFHVAVAHMAEQTGDLAKAEHHYREALRLSPKHGEALMSYAHMLDRQYKLAQAAELYRLAVQVQPIDPTCYNDLGICYARQGMLNEAVASIEKAIQLKPQQALYRNNIATILVQSKRLDEAFVHLSAVHPKAVAYYNLGYLLQGAGDQKGAARLFQEALSLDSSLTQAQVWLQKLRPAMAVTQPVAQPPAAVPGRQPQTIARRPAAMPVIVAPQTSMPAATVPPQGSPAPMPSVGALAPLPQIEPMPAATAPGLSPPQNLAPLPSITPLPPVHGGR